MVCVKEEALSQLARAKQVLTELKAKVDKTSLDDLDYGNKYIITSQYGSYMKIARYNI